jgi:hypothetical protein
MWLNPSPTTLSGHLPDEYNAIAATLEHLNKQLRKKEQTLADVGDRLSLGLAAKQACPHR